MLNKKIATVIYQPIKIDNETYASPSSLRLDLREYFKQTMPNIYFKQDEKYKPAKNLGCFLFGQPNTWKGLINIRIDNIINDKTKKSEISILIDDYRIFDEKLKQEIIKLMQEIIKNMDKTEKYIEIKELINNEEQINLNIKRKR